MKKYFVFSDVHSFYDELMTALEEKGFDINNQDHIVISCGDLFDRGDQSKECLEFIISMLKQDRAICIKGNHESLMTEVFDREWFGDHDVHNGTVKTFKQLTTLGPIVSSLDIIDDVKENETLNYYLMKCRDYYELGDNIFVHGWIPATATEDWKSGDWSRAHWANGMQCWSRGVRLPGKTIWCGHWDTKWGHNHLHDEWGDKYETFKDDGIVALDACTVLSHKVNVEVIEL